MDEPTPHSLYDRQSLHYEASALTDFLIAASGDAPDPDFLEERRKREAQGEISHPNADAYEHNLGIVFALESVGFFGGGREASDEDDHPDVVTITKEVSSVLDRWGWLERLRTQEGYPFDRDDPAVSLNPDEMRRLWQALRRLERSIDEMAPPPELTSAFALAKLSTFDRVEVDSLPFFRSLRFLDAAAFELLKKALEALEESPETLSSLRVQSYKEQYGIGLPGKHPGSERLAEIIRRAKQFLQVAEAGLLIEDDADCEASLIGYDWRDGEFYVCQSASALCDVVYGEDGQAGPSSVEFARGWNPEVNLGLRRLEAMLDALLNRWDASDWERRLIHSDANPERRSTISSAELSAFRRAIERIETGLSREDPDPSDGEGHATVSPPPSSGGGNALDGSGEVTTKGPPLPATRLAALLSRRKKATPAALVTLMDGRDSAPYEEVARKVHGDGTIDDGAIRANVSRTNRDLEALAAPFRFRCAGGLVHKVMLGDDTAQREGNGEVTDR